MLKYMKNQNHSDRKFDTASNGLIGDAPYTIPRNPVDCRPSQKSRQEFHDCVRDLQNPLPLAAFKDAISEDLMPYLLYAEEWCS